MKMQPSGKMPKNVNTGTKKKLNFNSLRKLRILVRPDLFRVCHRFRLTKQDDYFYITFDRF